jgi:nitroreductase
MSDRPLPAEAVELVLHAAHLAPSARNTLIASLDDAAAKRVLGVHDDVRVIVLARLAYPDPPDHREAAAERLSERIYLWLSEVAFVGASATAGLTRRVVDGPVDLDRHRGPTLGADHLRAAVSAPIDAVHDVRRVARDVDRAGGGGGDAVEEEGRRQGLRPGQPQRETLRQRLHLAAHQPAQTQTPRRRTPGEPNNHHEPTTNRRRLATPR